VKPGPAPDFGPNKPWRRKAKVVRVLRESYGQLPPAGLQRAADDLAAQEGLPRFDAQQALAPSPGPSLTERLKAVKKTTRQAVNRVAKKDSHAGRTRRPPMRSRERRPSTRRSRAAPTDGGSEPHPEPR
jgi:hypothetical protein